MKAKWIVIAYLIINIILALIPDLHNLIIDVTADWNNILRILVQFFFDPTAYVWKWLIGLLIAVIFLFKK
jgi:hypothetical protein